MSLTINWIWPASGPLPGGDAYVSLSGTATNLAITIGGQTATIVSTSGTTLARVRVPAATVAAAADVHASADGGSATLAGGYTYFTGAPKLYLSELSFGPASGTRPTTKGCAATVSTGSVTSPTYYALGPDVPPGSITGPYSGQVTATLTGSAGQFAGLGGFPYSLRGISSIAAQTWTFGIEGAEYTSGKYGNVDKVCWYVWRPSTSSIVGVIGDGTGDLSHPAGVLDLGFNAQEWVLFTLPGAAVSGVQDGDVLMLEVLACSDASHALYNIAHFNGAMAIGANGTAGNANAAAFIKPEFDLWVPPPSLTSLSPNSGTTLAGGTLTATATLGLTGATGATLGGVAVTDWVVSNDTHATFTKPAHAEATGDLVVTLVGGSTLTLTNAFTWVDTLSLSPTHVSTAGGGVTIGSNGWFGAGAAVTIDGVTPAYAVADTSTIPANAPAHAAGGVVVSVTSNGITKTATLTYDAPAPPAEPVKPQVIYRTFRSDDLTQPLYGPVKLEIESIAMKREGASFEAKAPSLNLNRTGTSYDLATFPMLRGLL